jgi:hypothetical protein
MSQRGSGTSEWKRPGEHWPTNRIGLMESRRLYVRATANPAQQGNAFASRRQRCRCFGTTVSIKSFTSGHWNRASVVRHGPRLNPMSREDAGSCSIPRSSSRLSTKATTAKGNRDAISRDRILRCAGHCTPPLEVGRDRLRDQDIRVWQHAGRGD